MNMVKEENIMCTKFPNASHSDLLQDLDLRLCIACTYYWHIIIYPYFSLMIVILVTAVIKNMFSGAMLNTISIYILYLMISDYDDRLITPKIIYW